MSNNIAKAVLGLTKFVAIKRSSGSRSKGSRNRLKGYRTIAQLLKAHEQADPEIQKQIAAMLLDRVEGRRRIWMKHHHALSEALIALGNQRALTTVVSCNEDLIVHFRLRLEPEVFAFPAYNVARAMLRLGQMRHDMEHLEAAVTAARRSADLFRRSGTEDHSNISSAVAAEGLASLAEISGKRDFLDKAVEIYDTILSVQSRDAMPFDWFMTQMNRANVLSSLGELTGDISVLREAVAGYEAALEFCTVEVIHSGWVMIQMNRANALKCLGDLIGDADALGEAVLGHEAALETYTRESKPTEWAGAQLNRANALKSLGQLKGDADILHDAVTSYDAALEVRSRNTKAFDWASTQLSRANALQSLGILTGDATVVRAAISGHEAALEVYSREAAPIGWSRAQLNRTNALESLNKLGGSYPLGELLQARFDAFDVLKGSDSQRLVLDLGRRIVEQLISSGDYKRAMSYIDHCLSISDAAIADASRSDSGKLEAVHQVSELHGMKALCLLNAGGSEMVWEATLAVEAGRARLARDAISAEVPSIAADRDSLSNAAPDCGALVLLGTFSSGGLAFIVQQMGDPVVVVLPGLSDDALYDRFYSEVGWLEAQNRMRQAIQDLRFSRGSEAWLIWNAHLDEQANWLQETLIAPIEEALIAAGRKPTNGTQAGDPIVFLPTGLLGLLPITAARKLGETTAFCERWSLSLAPSASIFSACRERASRWSHQTATYRGFYFPTPKFRKVDFNAPVLAGAGFEAEFARSYLAQMPKTRRQILIDTDASLKQAMVPETSEASHIHFGAHGNGNAFAPDQGGIDLLDGRFRLAELQQIRLNARIVTLSTCESGHAGIRKAPEEFVGLGNGMLTAGAAAAITTLWSVNDDTATTFTTKFLAAHLNPDGSERMPPAEAFRDTQFWLRHVTTDELKTNKEWFWPGGAESAREAGAGQCKGLSGSMISQLPTGNSGYDRPFKDPHDWAAFSYHGA